MRTFLRKRAATSLAAGTLLLGGLGLVAGGVIPVPLDVLNTSNVDEAPEDHGAPEVTGDDDVEAQDEDGPDENASQTAKDVHEAQRLAGELGDDAPSCAHGKYVSAAATGAWDPFDAEDEPPAFEDMPCFGNGDDDDDVSAADEDADDDDGEDGPPAHAKDKDKDKGDVDGDGAPGRSGGPSDDE